MTKVWVGLYLCTNAAYGDAKVVRVSCDLGTVQDAVREHVKGSENDLKDFEWVKEVKSGNLIFTNWSGTDYVISLEEIQ